MLIQQHWRVAHTYCRLESLLHCQTMIHCHFFFSPQSRKVKPSWPQKGGRGGKKKRKENSCLHWVIAICLTLPGFVFILRPSDAHISNSVLLIFWLVVCTNFRKNVWIHSCSSTIFNSSGLQLKLWSIMVSLEIVDG